MPGEAEDGLNGFQDSLEHHNPGQQKKHKWRNPAIYALCDFFERSGLFKVTIQYASETERGAAIAPPFKLQLLSGEGLQPPESIYVHYVLDHVSNKKEKNGGAVSPSQLDYYVTRAGHHHIVLGKSPTPSKINVAVQALNCLFKAYPSQAKIVNIKCSRFTSHELDNIKRLLNIGIPGVTINTYGKVREGASGVLLPGREKLIGEHTRPLANDGEKPSAPSFEDINDHDNNASSPGL